MLGVLVGVKPARVLETLVFSKEPLHLREIARRSGVSPIAASRILDRFSKAKLVERDRFGNLVLFNINRSFEDGRLLCEVVEKTRGVVPVLKERLGKEKKIAAAFVYGSFASETEGAKSDVDLMVVGRLDWAAVSSLVRDLEWRFGREINYTVYSPDEFARKKSTPFLSRVLKGEKIMLVGELEKS